MEHTPNLICVEASGLTWEEISLGLIRHAHNSQRTYYQPGTTISPAQFFQTQYAQAPSQIVAEVRETLKNGPCYVDYLCAVPIKATVGGSHLDTTLYDRDYGEGTAEAVIKALYAQKP